MHSSIMQYSVGIGIAFFFSFDGPIKCQYLSQNYWCWLQIMSGIVAGCKHVCTCVHSSVHALPAQVA